MRGAIFGSWRSGRTKTITKLVLSASGSSASRGGAWIIHNCAKAACLSSCTNISCGNLAAIEAQYTMRAISARLSAARIPCPCLYSACVIHNPSCESTQSQFMSNLQKHYVTSKAHKVMHIVLVFQGERFKPPTRPLTTDKITCFSECAPSHLQSIQ
ncbi:hypothetical protein FB567DRAFT_334289 [Paraphoma chrysanthemicola]|uniref:Uncharacterized protein n=1 Tax=Paraphoma chrysanthemicola TaxID=798071 RepID=A0A8K0R776_9PLEO|nr:hypothetical protein FB567DRAFT_334289 [Paraphoma chrysanthemicola]